MTVHFECQCGRKLQAQDEFRGKRVGCRSCGEVMLVPGMAKEQVPIREVLQPQRTARTEPSSEEHQAVADGKEKVRRRKKKKKKGARFSLPAVDIFGIQLTLRTGLAACCVA